MHHEEQSEPPTLLLVHGGWAGAWIWEPVLDPLRVRGVRVEAIDQLPSAGTDPGALGDLYADAAYVQARIAEIGAPVALCGHSYGGMVITELADGPAISHSIYLAAFLPEQDQSLSDLIGGALPEWIVDRRDGSLALTDDVERARQALFADLDADRATQIHARMALQSGASLVVPSRAPNGTHPAVYVLCTEDQALPVQAQEAMAARTDHTIRLHTAHCPQLSAPEQLADVLAEVVQHRVAA